MNKHIGYSVIALGLLLVPAPAIAAVSTWIGGIGDWEIAGNWNPVGVPPATNETHILQNGPAEVVTVTAAGAQSARLVMENGADLIITNGADLAIAGQALLGNDVSSVGSIIKLDGGDLSVGAEWALGVTGGASLEINSGTANANGGWFMPGYLAGSTGNIVLNGGALNTSASTVFYVGFDGSGSLTNNGGTVTANNAVIAGQNAAGSGEIVVNSGTFTVAGTFAVGQSGTGSLTVNGGTVNANGPWLIPGYLVGGTGDIAVNGGNLNVAGPLHVGYQGDGSLTVTGGVVDVGADLTVGADGGTGDVVMNGGTVTAPNLSFGGTGTQTLDLNGGQLITTDGFSQSANSTFYIGSGELIFEARTLEEVQGAIADGDGTWIFDDWPIIVSNELGVVVTSGPKPPTAAADIVSVTSLSNDVMQLEINTPSPTEYYYPESKLDLTGGTWERIPHSDDGVNPFIIEDLNYSTTDGTNVFIYVETTNSAEFIRILGFD
jgi:hypothetical protein